VLQYLIIHILLAFQLNYLGQFYEQTCKNLGQQRC